MANAFSKQETILFEDFMEGFQDNLVLSKAVKVMNSDDVTMERANNVVWVPQPYIAVSYAGRDMTANFKAQTQMSVPVSLGYERCVPITLNPLELRDAIQEESLGKAAKQRLASDINVAVLTAAANQGTLFVKRTTASVGFDDIAQVDSIMNEQGVPNYDRVISYGSADYNGAASNLASRDNVSGKVLTAYEKALVNQIGGFDILKLDYALSKTAAAGGGSITISTLAGASNYYVPKATSVATTGETSNVDNRYQSVTVSSTTSVVAGDAFTIADVYAAHHITKGSTGNLKTFRVASVTDSTHMVISPPIISNQGGSNAEAQYQNTVVTAGSGKAIVFLNTATKPLNVFWQKDAIALIPGRYVVPTDAGAAVMKSSTDQGITVTMSKQYDVMTMNTYLRFDTFYGVAVLQPEMVGVMMFSQS
jgi:hypothetical protein